MSQPSILFEPLPHRGRLFKYFEKKDYALSWERGGQIPISLASSFLSNHRDGIFTPDEVLQARLVGCKKSDFRGILELGPDVRGGRIHNIGFKDFGDDDFTYVKHAEIDHFEEDAYILCMSTVLSAGLMAMLKKSCAIEILDLERLRSSLDEVLGKKSVSGSVRYTNNEDRGHFMKSEADSWQEEYRMAWTSSGQPTVWVDIPEGIGKMIDFGDRA
ncbi:hypothetical protein E5A73_02380 [Sphingomonas gei]|uniref:Uncharacterized protein n=1 Tax=Sphingomonas gei TaxID=1395960 RepID=A0A4V3QZY4_9SPHN|nr:hypothetical protein [Sphingomonas gei]TGX55982.1 hypothetical protein E5A73_02380 [Sphingomonas gei]